MSPQLHPEGFRISDRPVAASFAHPYSWQKVPDNVIKDEACIDSTVAIGGVDGDWARYWDESSTVAVLEFEVEQPTPAKPQIGPVKQEKKQKKAGPSKSMSVVNIWFFEPTHFLDVDDEVAAFLGSMEDELTAASAMPVLDKPLTLSFSKPAVAAAKAVVVPPCKCCFCL